MSPTKSSECNFCEWTAYFQQGRNKITRHDRQHHRVPLKLKMTGQSMLSLNYFRNTAPSGIEVIQFESSDRFRVYRLGNYFGETSNSWNRLHILLSDWWVKRPFYEWGKWCNIETLRQNQLKCAKAILFQAKRYVRTWDLVYGRRSKYHDINQWTLWSKRQGRNRKRNYGVHRWKITHHGMKGMKVWISIQLKSLSRSA